MSLDCGGNVGILVRPARELFGEHPLRCGLDLPDCQFLRLDTAGIRTLRSVSSMHGQKGWPQHVRPP